MSLVKVSGNASGTGTLTIAAPNTNSDYTLTLPTGTGTFNISGVVNEVPAGTVSAPSIYPTGDTNTGIFFPAADTIAFTEGGAESMRIDNAGDVMIGGTTVSANAKLNVYQADSAQRVVHFENTRNVSGDENLRLVLGSNCNDTASAPLVVTTGGADKLYIHGNGNVVNVNNSYGTLSDIKLKENIADATPKLADIMRLQVRNFNLKADPSHKQIGFIAQEFEQVFPAIVDESPNRGQDGAVLEETTKSIKTSVLIPILVKAIQEQQAIIIALTTRITALENK